MKKTEYWTRCAYQMDLSVLFAKESSSPRKLSGSDPLFTPSLLVPRIPQMSECLSALSTQFLASINQSGLVNGIVNVHPQRRFLIGLRAGRRDP